jgi:hypothetical protein
MIEFYPSVLRTKQLGSASHMEIAAGGGSDTETTAADSGIR